MGRNCCRLPDASCINSTQIAWPRSRLRPVGRPGIARRSRHQALKSALDVAGTLNNIGGAHYSQGEYEQAIESYRKSLVIEERLGNKEGAAAALFTIALVHYARGDYARSIDYYNRNLSLRVALLVAFGNAESEVKALGQFYGDRQSRTLTGGQATEERFKSEAARARALHVSTAGLLNDASPMFSYLGMPGPGAKEDGLLQAWEILKLDLRADVVVISATETARPAAAGYAQLDS